ncbi:transcriptional attenuator, LytR family [Deinococcus reticulitermitis]|uniref:Transcriptional attenuator, LytR family n=1 Tax=Deinococcus reticulitermitis TaxID=856736 RepID=A0A1H7AJ09_9DEIO|nr:transcriptional attenuator, LytR family [Deinococcus reticulitermitis]
MRRRFILVAVVLLASLAGWFAYRSQHQVRQAWQQIYHELGGGRVPDPQGVLDDPLFQALPPPEKPVSLGRYTPATPPKPVASAPVSEPQPAPQPVPKPASVPAPPTPNPPAPRSPAVPARQEAPTTAPAEVSPPPAAAPTPQVAPKPPSPQPPKPRVPVATPAPSPAPAEAPMATKSAEAVKQQPPAQPPASPAPRPAPVPVSKPAEVTRPEPRAPAPPKPPRAAPVAVAAPRAPAPVRRPAAVTGKFKFIDRVVSSHRLHILVMGNDQESLRQGRADVLMVLTFDPVGQKLIFLNIPRDTRVFLPGRGWVKINSGYAYGGPELQITMVERFLGIPMDKYIEISQGGFKAAIDAVGGVEVRPRFAFTVNDRYEFPLGPQRLDGTMALIYSTMRKQDPEGDLGRNRRQQEVLRSLLTEFGQLEPLDLGPLMTSLLGELATNMRTDLTPAELLALRRHHAYVIDEQTTERVQGKGGTIGRTWFYSVPDRERQRLHLLLRDQ